MEREEEAGERLQHWRSIEILWDCSSVVAGEQKGESVEVVFVPLGYDRVYPSGTPHRTRGVRFLSFAKEFLDEVGALHFPQFADDVLAFGCFVPEKKLALGEFLLGSFG